ncbi:hypothetical protein BpHYR1_036234 [Brachionus plicatilis]|uniref:Uncharacterized protein n=1 Tax=Brachionus plicatilis TaxID=10195 RepID=A0A3M7S3X7_BRAPC|nr:hypothetical protein BpHYR1_036234 [Brachionus plicatilis]
MKNSYSTKETESEKDLGIYLKKNLKCGQLVPPKKVKVNSASGIRGSQHRVAIKFSRNCAQRENFLNKSRKLNFNSRYNLLLLMMVLADYY